MKRTLLVVVLVVALTFAFAASAFATTGKFFANSTSYYSWNKPPVISPGTASPAGLFNIGSNPANPGVHANYLATTAKCGICHSVHRAAATGTKLLPQADATCAGCHTGGTTITTKIITWTPYDTAWVPQLDPTVYLPADCSNTTWQSEWVADSKAAAAKIINQSAAGGAANGGGPHNDSALDLIVDGYWNGTGPTPLPTYAPGTRYGCFTRRCHITNPHGAGSSKYKIFAAKLLFNNTPAEDNAEEGKTGGTYGGLDAQWDSLGAIDAAVERFVSANSSIMSTTTAGDVLIHGVAPDANEREALVAGLTCGRPSNPTTGEDECHAEASYAIVDKGIKEQRNHGTGITAGSAYRTDNTGEEALGYGGNDNRDWKTGHVAGTFGAVNSAASYSAINGCTSCHDQKDFGNTVTGNFTFPHGQVAYGGSNLSVDGVNPLPAQPYVAANPAYDVKKTWADNQALNANAPRSRIWAGYGGAFGSQLTFTAGTNEKAYDGQCLKCHRDGAGNGIGLTQ